MLLCKCGVVCLLLLRSLIGAHLTLSVQVDDDDKSDLDDDDLEAINATAAAAEAESGAQTAKDGQQQKSVRMSVTGVAPGVQTAAQIMYMVYVGWLVGAPSLAVHLWLCVVHGRL